MNAHVVAGAAMCMKRPTSTPPPEKGIVRDNWGGSSSLRRRPPYAKDSTGSIPRGDRWRTWDTSSADLDDDDVPAPRLIAMDRLGPILICFAVLVAVGAGIWFAWPSGPSGGSEVPAAVQTTTDAPGV